MILKIENPLNLELEQVEILITELQENFDRHSQDLPEFLFLEESGCAIEIKTKSCEYNYNLEQLKLLKKEFLDPVTNSLKEIC